MTYIFESHVDIIYDDVLCEYYADINTIPENIEIPSGQYLITFQQISS